MYLPWVMTGAVSSTVTLVAVHSLAVKADLRVHFSAVAGVLFSRLRRPRISFVVPLATSFAAISAACIVGQMPLLAWRYAASGRWSNSGFSPALPDRSCSRAAPLHNRAGSFHTSAVSFPRSVQTAIFFPAYFTTYPTLSGVSCGVWNAVTSKSALWYGSCRTS